MKINNENSCRILNFRIRQLQPKHISFILFSVKKHGTEIRNRMRPIMIADSRLLRQLAYEQAIPFDGVVQMIRKSAGCLRPCTFSASAASFIGKNLVGFDKSAKRMVQLLCHLLKLTQSPHHGFKVKRIFQFKLTAEKQHMRIFFTSFPAFFQSAHGRGAGPGSSIVSAAVFLTYFPDIRPKLQAGHRNFARFPETCLQHCPFYFFILSIPTFACSVFS